MHPFHDPPSPSDYAPPSSTMIEVITSAEKLKEVIAYWKKSTFSPDYLSLDEVIASLDTDSPLVEPFEPYTNTWKVR